MKKVLISAVKKQSLAGALGIKPGDFLLKLNGEFPRDIFDYYELCGPEEGLLEVLRPGRQKKRLCIRFRKQAGELLGLTFSAPAFDGMKRCANRCLFCFIDQLPPGLRPSLYLKDDDYRHSFFFGNFITLTNLTPADWERILRLRISPLYISVHTTNPSLRAFLLGNPRAANIKAELARLATARIAMHFQVVLLPGVNDGEELKKTLTDLAAYRPAARSVGIVPVGVTKYRRGRFPLRKYTPAEARKLIAEVSRYQKWFKKRMGTRFAFLADEFYLLAGAKLPPSSAYEGFPQLENGIGLARTFLDAYRRYRFLLPRALAQKRRVALVCGTLAKELLLRVAGDLERRVKNLEVEVEAVENRFFGPEVTVSGLLTAEDIQEAVAGKGYDFVLLPRSVLAAKEKVFLDSKPLSWLRESLESEVEVLPGALALILFLRKLAGEKKRCPKNFR